MSKERYSPWITPGSEAEREAWEALINHFKEVGPEMFYSYVSTKASKENVIASEEDKHQGSFSVVTKNRALTEEQMIELFQVDIRRWEVTHFTVNTWGVGYKMPSGQLATEPLYQTKLKLARPQGIDYTAIADAIAESAKKYKFKDIGKVSNNYGPYGLEVVVTDHHFGKIGSDGFSWTLYEADRAYKKAVMGLVDKAMNSNGGKSPEEIILPVGNDLLHWDNVLMQTTAGTKMSGHPVHYSEIFAAALEAVIWSIQFCSARAQKVVVPIVPGNHDRSSVCAMAVALQAVFAESDTVKILFNDSGRVYHAYGESIIGYHHFDMVDTKSIAGIVNADLRARRINGSYRNFYVHGGHHHKRKAIDVVTRNDEFGGVEVCIFPALCPADSFHNDNGYIGKSRRATAVCYHPVFGKDAEFFWDINNLNYDDLQP